MVPVAVVVQPPFSVTVTVYDPADKPVTVAEVAPRTPQIGNWVCASC